MGWRVLTIGIFAAAAVILKLFAHDDLLAGSAMTAAAAISVAGAMTKKGNNDDRG